MSNTLRADRDLSEQENQQLLERLATTGRNRAEREGDERGSNVTDPVPSSPSSASESPRVAAFRSDDPPPRHSVAPVPRLSLASVQSFRMDAGTPLQGSPMASFRTEEWCGEYQGVGSYDDPPEVDGHDAPDQDLLQGTAPQEADADQQRDSGPGLVPPVPDATG